MTINTWFPGSITSLKPVCTISGSVKPPTIVTMVSSNAGWRKEEPELSSTPNPLSWQFCWSPQILRSPHQPLQPLKDAHWTWPAPHWVDPLLHRSSGTLKASHSLWNPATIQASTRMSRPSLFWLLSLLRKMMATCTDARFGTGLSDNTRNLKDQPKSLLTVRNFKRI